jgi:hypothetical protein
MPAFTPQDYPIVGPGTPYVTPDILTAAATGVSWSSIGSQASVRPSSAEQRAEQWNICRRASSMADGMVNLVMRATVDTEQLSGPGDFRFQLQNGTGRARLLLSRSPVTSVLGGQWTPAGAFPATWTPLAANQFRIEKPPIGIYGTTSPGGSGDGGQAVYLAPGQVTWLFGRYNVDVQVTYTNGWPHGSLTTPVAAGATSIHIDDCTGWGPPPGGTSGAGGIMYDQAGQEAILVTAASATSGPGTLTLATALQFNHDYGVMVSAMPGAIQQAVILLAVSQAIVRGSTATTVQAVPGSSVGPGATQKQFVDAAKMLLSTYRRVV